MSTSPCYCRECQTMFTSYGAWIEEHSKAYFKVCEEKEGKKHTPITSNSSLALVGMLLDEIQMLKFNQDKLMTTIGILSEKLSQTIQLGIPLEFCVPVVIQSQEKEDVDAFCQLMFDRSVIHFDLIVRGSVNIGTSANLIIQFPVGDFSFSQANVISFKNCYTASRAQQHNLSSGIGIKIQKHFSASVQNSKSLPLVSIYEDNGNKVMYIEQNKNVEIEVSGVLVSAKSIFPITGNNLVLFCTSIGKFLCAPPLERDEWSYTTNVRDENCLLMIDNESGWKIRSSSSTLKTFLNESKIEIEVLNPLQGLITIKSGSLYVGANPISGKPELGPNQTLFLIRYINPS